jgi:hypothetical protein
MPNHHHEQPDHEVLHKQELPQQQGAFNEDIWVKGILPAVGMGYFAFVGGVSHQMKQFYKANCDSVEDPPRVKWERHIRRSTKVDTFYSAVFSSVPCAEFGIVKVLKHMSLASVSAHSSPRLEI